MKWEDKFKSLKRYLKEHDNEYPICNVIYDGFDLYSWINDQKNIYANGIELPNGTIKYNRYILTEERVKLLKSINFPFYVKTWSYQKRKICFPDDMQKVRRYLLYMIENNLKDIDLNILNEKVLEYLQPKDDTVNAYWLSSYKKLSNHLKENNGKYPMPHEELYEWVIFQRTVYANGIEYDDGSIRYRNYCLSKKEIDLLNKINFKWYINTPLFLKNRIDSKEQMQKVRRYYSYVSCNIQGLEKMSNAQKHYAIFNSNKSRVQLNEKFNYKCNLLIEYLKEHNNIYPSRREVYKGINLADWVSTIRSIYFNGVTLEDGSLYYNGCSLTKEQINILKSINFKFIGNEKIFKSKKIKNKYQMNGIERYILDSMENEENITNEKVLKMLNKS